MGGGLGAESALCWGKRGKTRRMGVVGDVVWRLGLIVLVCGFVTGVRVRTGEVLVSDERSENDSMRILGGTRASISRYSYIGFYSGQSICTCSLVAPNKVLIAAHCLPNADERATVSFGGEDYNVFPRPGTPYDVQSVSIMPKYDPSSLEVGYDVAILTLAKNVDTPGVSILNIDTKVAPAGVAHAIGFGWAEDLRNDFLLRQASLPIVPGPSCMALDILRLFKYERYVCAGGPPVDGVKKGVCSGDSGGPLIIPGESADEDVVVGVASFVVGTWHL